MKRRYIYLHALIVGLFIQVEIFAIEAGKPLSSVQITYIANEGFLIESAHKKILVDALFGEKAMSFCDNPEEETLRDMIAARGEFSDVDLVAVTHRHRDHLFAPFVAGHLSANPAAGFLSCQQTVELLAEEEEYEKFSEQVIEVTPDSLMYKDTVIHDIGVRVYRLVHGPYLVEDPNTGLSIDRHQNIQNLGFLFNVGGVKVFHCGDSSPRCIEDYEHFRLDREGIDIAIMGRGFLASTTGLGVEILRDLVKADHIVLMHIHQDQNPYYKDVAKQVEDEFPSVTIFEKLMDSKTFTVSH